MCELVSALLPTKGKSPVRPVLLAVALTSGLLLVGCKKDSTDSNALSIPTNNAAATLIPTNPAEPVAPGMQGSPLDFTNVLRSFHARGIVRELAADGHTVVVRHEDIPGFMPKMTMAFNVRDAGELRGIHAGDAITFNVKATEDDSWIEHIRRASTNDMAALPPADPASSMLLHAAQMKVGDVLPDAELLAEDGRTIRLSDFRGRALAFTFIFTRCPLPNFCPRMNQNFSRARDLLLERSSGPTNWQFLSISFDAEFDKPGVLNRYAYSYRGKNTDRWLFAAAPTNVMSAMAAQLDFRFANEGGSFLHNLRTVVIDPQRRVYHQFDGNTWKADQLAQALTDAATGKAK